MGAFGRIGLWAGRLKVTWRRAANEEGIAAVEFALLLPVMITLFFGVVETSLALLCRADVSIMASTAADLISQSSALNKTDLGNIYSAAGTILYPYYDPSAGAATPPTLHLTSLIDPRS